VRVLLLDPEQRLLLFAGPAAENSARTVWFAAGGGIEAGETPQAAAVREIREETGLDGVVLGPHIWNRRHVLVLGHGDGVDLREVYFLAHVPAFEVDTRGFTAEELDYVTAWRWWTVDELEATPDLLAPRDLPSLLREVLRDGPPTAPMTIGV